MDVVKGNLQRVGVTEEDAGRWGGGGGRSAEEGATKRRLTFNVGQFEDVKCTV